VTEASRQGYVVRRAERGELAALAAIEREAGRRFETVPELAAVPEIVTSAEALAEAERRGQVWVAVSTAGEPIGFACADVVDDGVHLEEIDVLPAWGRRGVGQALIAAVDADARARGLAAVTLTTFRDVAWNAPFYARLGFRVVAPSDLTPGLAAIVAAEAARGLPPALRVVMRRPV
jgi:GNAT superfamily N-acetyltransferase